MDQPTLVGPDINLGLEVLEVLDAAGIRPLVALLAVLSEYEDWRLVVSSSSLDQNHQLKAYDKVAEALHGQFLNKLPPLLILPVKDPFIRELRAIFGKAKAVAGMRLGGQKIGNRFVDSAYVYRIR